MATYPDKKLRDLDKEESIEATMRFPVTGHKRTDNAKYVTGSQVCDFVKSQIFDADGKLPLNRLTADSLNFIDVLWDDSHIIDACTTTQPLPITSEISINTEGAQLVYLAKEKRIYLTHNGEYYGYWKDCSKIGKSIFDSSGGVVPHAHLNFMAKPFPGESLNFGWCRWDGEKLAEVSQYPLSLAIVPYAEDIYAQGVNPDYEGLEDLGMLPEDYWLYRRENGGPDFTAADSEYRVVFDTLDKRFYLMAAEPGYAGTPLYSNWRESEVWGTQANFGIVPHPFKIYYNLSTGEYRQWTGTTLSAPLSPYDLKAALTTADAQITKINNLFIRQSQNYFHLASGKISPDERPVLNIGWTDSEILSSQIIPTGFPGGTIDMDYGIVYSSRLHRLLAVNQNGGIYRFWPEMENYGTHSGTGVVPYTNRIFRCYDSGYQGLAGGLSGSPFNGAILQWNPAMETFETENVPAEVALFDRLFNELCRIEPRPGATSPSGFEPTTIGGIYYHYSDHGIDKVYRLNGLDLTYEEAVRVVADRIAGTQLFTEAVLPYVTVDIDFHGRTNFPIFRAPAWEYRDCGFYSGELRIPDQTVISSSAIEVLNLQQPNGFDSFNGELVYDPLIFVRDAHPLCFACHSLHTVVSPIIVDAYRFSDVFMFCSSLKNVKLIISKHVEIFEMDTDSISSASIEYTIKHASRSKSSPLTIYLKNQAFDRICNELGDDEFKELLSVAEDNNVYIVSC